MARGPRRGCGRLRSSGSLLWRRRNGWTRRRPGNNRAWHRRNLCRLGRRNDHRLRNCRSRRRHRGLGFDGARRRRDRAARLGNNGSGRWRNHGRRRRRSYHGGLHASRSGGGFFRSFIRYRFLFGLCLRFGNFAKVLAHFYRGGYINRAGVCFFLGNPGFGQIVDDGLCLDLEFASQFVDSDLNRIGHCPPGRLLFPVLVGNFG